MSTWRSREMKLEEWIVFQNQFEEAFFAKGAPEGWALFVKSEPGRDASTLLVTPEVSMTATLDWAPMMVSVGSEFGFLVGHDKARELFGIGMPGPRKQ